MENDKWVCTLMLDVTATVHTQYLSNPLHFGVLIKLSTLILILCLSLIVLFLHWT